MATITVSADKVIEAVELTIQQIQAARESQNEKMIAQAIKASTPSKFAAFFGKKQLTREEAIAKLRKDIWGWYPSNVGWADLNHAKKLMVLAKNGDPVTLNEEDCRVLF